MTIISIVVCLWAIALELYIRKREKGHTALCQAVAWVADGKYQIKRSDTGNIEFKPTNRGAK